MATDSPIRPHRTEAPAKQCKWQKLASFVCPLNLLFETQTGKTNAHIRPAKLFNSGSEFRRQFSFTPCFSALMDETANGENGELDRSRRQHFHSVDDKMG